MKLQEFSTQYKGTSIYGQYTQPDDVQAVVVLVHGMGEHSGRYIEHVVPALLKTNLAVVLYDNFGHGKSEGKKGHCPSYEALMKLLSQVIVEARKLFPKTPLFLYGHSMGANLVLNYALRRKDSIHGIVATSPYLRLAFEPPKWKMVIGKAMMGVWPSITLPSGLNPYGISRIPEEVEKYVNDPLVHDKVSPMFSFPIMDAGEWALESAQQLKVNTLLLHGTDDLIIDHQATKIFHENATTTTLQLFEGGYHELHYDLCREEVLNTIQNWLQQQL
ncbi:MAG: alpha/beta hydrolase [Flavobacteriaceae bacterium]|nr:MAG: alpha/beta hydrolase [Flavobacteriaceae bacterium]